ncbi:MAG: transcriptional regulator, partial [Deltaproteobacteria bacterium RBG_13_49_15]
MTNTEFAHFRKKLKKTQKQMAQLFGTSIKAIHSYEQGWRTIPPHVERQLFFLLWKTKNEKKTFCWAIKGCPPEQRKKCPAWEFHAGDLCWFICGTLCEGEARKSWREKIGT